MSSKTTAQETFNWWANEVRKLEVQLEAAKAHFEAARFSLMKANEKCVTEIVEKATHVYPMPTPEEVEAAKKKRK